MTGSVTDDWKKGRWPSNFTLTHHPDCRRVGTRRVRGTKPPASGSATRQSGFAMGALDKLTHYADPDGYETVTAWDCVPECPVRRLGEMSGERKSGGKRGAVYTTDKKGLCFPELDKQTSPAISDTGTAARFYYQADWSYEAAEFSAVAERLATADPVKYQSKASRKERDAGLEEWDISTRHTLSGGECIAEGRTAAKGKANGRNPHPTVKPIALTRWLATLILPPPEYAPRRLLIPFSGSGSEGIGAGLAGWEEMVLIDLLAENNEIAEARLEHWLNGSHQLGLNLVS